MRIWHLLSHTSGLTYGFMYSHPVDTMYREAGHDFGWPAADDLAAACRTWAQLPLLFQPGTGWAYSVATDVVGRLIEILTGQSLEEAFQDRVLRPLGMDDTVWWADGEVADRLAALYIPNPADGTALRWDPVGNLALSPPTLFSGGGGLLSTLADYVRFTQMLVGGGEFQGTRILGPRTLAFMTQNHLPGGADLASFGSGQFAEVAYSGVGFGLGFGVTTDPVRSKVLSGVGEFTWGGAASTAFFVDPAEELSVVFMTQLLPSSRHAIRSQLRQLVYQAIVD
ncbi:MAG: serine hydrolase domain-containing protein [Ilumatobacteraceae bacterium]